MADHSAGEVEVRAFGKRRVFRLGVNEMLELQNDLGLADKDDAFLAVFDEDKLRNLARVRKIAFFGLKGDWPEMTEEDAGKVVTEVGLVKFGEVIKLGLRWALPEKEPPTETGGATRPSDGPTSSSTRPERESRRTK